MATEIAESTQQSEMCLMRLARVTGVDLNAVAFTGLYTVPVGKRALIRETQMKDLSDDTLLVVLSLGQSGAKTDWAGPLLVADYLEAAEDALIVTPKMDLYGFDTWDAGSIADGDEEAKDITVTGAALGDFADAAMGVDVTDLHLDAQVTAPNTVTAVLANNTGGAIDLASTTIYVKVELRNRKLVEYTAGEIFGVDVTTAAGAACTATFDVVGILLDE